MAARDFTILSAVYASPDNDSAIVTTAEVGAVALSQVDTPEDWQQLLDSGVAIGSYEPPAVPSPLPSARAMALLLVDAEGGVGGIETSVDIAWAMELEPGVYWIGLDEALSNPVIPAPSCSPVGHQIGIAEQSGDFLELHVRERSTGEFARPSRISFVAFA